MTDSFEEKLRKASLRIEELKLKMNDIIAKEKNEDDKTMTELFALIFGTGRIFGFVIGFIVCFILMLTTYALFLRG